MSDTDETTIITPRSVRSNKIPAGGNGNGNDNSNGINGGAINQNGVGYNGASYSDSGERTRRFNPRTQWTHDPNDAAIIGEYFSRNAQTETIEHAQRPFEETTVMPGGALASEAETSVLQPPRSTSNAAAPADATATLPREDAGYGDNYSDDYGAETMVAPTRVAPPLPRTAASSSAAHTMPPLKGQAEQPFEQPFEQQAETDVNDIDDAEFDDAPAIAPAELPTDWQSEMAPPKATNGFLLPVLLTLPVAAISAAMPATGAIFGLIITICATAYGYARRNQIMREEKRGGIRKNSDSFKILAGSPINLLHAILRAIPDAIVWILVYAATNGLCSLTSAGSDLEGSWTITLFGRQVGLPVLSGSPTSASGLILAIAASIAWALTAILRRQRTPLRLGFIQWQLAIRRGADRILSAGINWAKYDTRTHPVSSGFGIALIVVFLAFAAAAATILTASSSISWLPISALTL